MYCFQETSPSQDVNELKKWQKLNEKAKSSVVLCLGDTALAKVCHVIDDQTVLAKTL